MNANESGRWSAWDAGAAVLAGILATVAMIPNANAELVYDAEAETASAIEPPRVEERTTLRQAISASEKAQATLAQPAQTPTQVIVSQPAPVVQAPAPVQTQYVQPQVIQQPVVQQPLPVAPAAYVQVGPAQTTESSEVQNLSKSELLRRERVRAELQNEDMLQQRLEELRLRDEQRRSEQLATGFSGAVGGALPAPAQVSATVAPIQEQVVVAPVTDRPGQAVTAIAQPVAQDQVVLSSSAATLATETDRTILTIQPRAGIAEMSGETLYDIRPRFSTGVSLGMVSSDNLSFELGYTFSEYGVALASSNPYAQTAYAYGYAQSAETVAMKQNVIDAGMKLHVLGPDAKLRPFLGGGAAYSISYINYDQRILEILNRDPVLRSSMASDYELNSYLGYLAGGLDLRVSKGVSVGALFKYYSVLSSRERSAINNPAIYGGYSNYAYTGADADKQYVGGSLSKTSFYMMQGGVTFTF